MEHYGDTWQNTLVTYTNQREQNGFAHTLLTTEEHVKYDFVLMLGDNIVGVNLCDIIRRQRVLYRYGLPR